MSEARFPRRFALLLATVLSFAFFQCRPYVAPPAGGTAAGFTGDEILRLEEREPFCTSGSYSKGRPVICIDNATLKPNFDPAVSWDVEGSNGKPTDRPVTVHWYARAGGNLRIEFAPGSTCVGTVQCNGNGHCVARVQPLKAGERRECKYDVVLDGRRYDPEFIVNPCCW